MRGVSNDERVDVEIMELERLSEEVLVSTFGLK